MTSASAALAAFLFFAQAGVAGALSGTTPVRLDVKADSACTARAALIARVEARSPRIRFVESENVLAIRADFAIGQADSVVGEITFLGPGGKPSSRRILARSCAEAADAVALIIAVTLDPVAASSSNPKPTTEPTAAEGTLTGEGSTDATARVTGAAAANGSPAPSAPRPEERPSKETPSVEERPATSEKLTANASSWHAGLALSGGALWGPAPTVMPDVAAYATLGLDRASPWSPSLTLGVLHAWRHDLAEPGGQASFSLDGASLDGCVLRLLFSPLEMRACGSALIGVVTSRGQGAPQAATAHRPFAAIGTTALVAVGLGTRFELVGRLGTGLTLVRDSYEFGTTVFHRASRLTTAVSLGISLRLR